MAYDTLRKDFGLKLISSNNLQVRLAAFLYVIELTAITIIDILFVASLVYVCLNPILTLFQGLLAVAISIGWHNTGLSAHTRVWSYWKLKANKQPSTISVVAQKDQKKLVHSEPQENPRENLRVNPDLKN